MTTDVKPDPLFVLRQYRDLAPWNLHDLTSLAGALLETAGVRPINAAATVHPSDRTIRYYVAQGLLAAPEGRGTSATYSYRHLLQVLWIKLRQMEGATLGRIRSELTEQTGDVVERRVASALGSGLTPPNRLMLREPETARGRAGKAIHHWNALAAALDDPSARRFAATKWHRIPVMRGLELHLHEGHPLAKHIARSDDIADQVRAAVNRLLLDQE